MNQADKKQDLLLREVYRDPQYKGKHIIIGDRIYARKTGQAKNRLLDTLLPKYPEDAPIITYIPAADSLILVHINNHKYEDIFSL